ncbi:MAG: hypothetical protein COB75_08860 [Idiomarina sp.]|nr:adenylosuccinate synthetase [Idiomarina sp.]PHQ72531.1 MAG: hypothetical protein COB75_08860 [Idiomarina sp.]
MKQTPFDKQRQQRYDNKQREFLLAIITDEDDSSQVELDDGQTAWRSTLRYDELVREATGTYELHDIEEDDGGEHHLISLIAEGGRGAEFSELVMFGKHLMTFDDRTGLVCEIRHQNQLVPRQILMTGSGDEKFKGFKLVDSEHLINAQRRAGKKILAEGAQGTLLDIDFGSYPFVTSSNTITAGACTGLGVAPNQIGEVYGIFKAYCTRVGSGPFPTELDGEVGERMRKAGHEFGATTGRPRRCGWIDIPALKYACMINGVTQLIMTKADVLSEFEHIKVCTAYEYLGEKIDYLPFDVVGSELTPVYEELEGWSEDLTGLGSIDEIPSTLQAYIDYLERILETPITIVSVGPDRNQTLMRESTWVIA